MADQSPKAAISHRNPRSPSLPECAARCTAETLSSSLRRRHRKKLHQHGAARDGPLIAVRDLFLGLFRKQECDLGLDLPVRTIYRRKHIVVAAQHEENGLFADLRELPEAAAKRQRPAPAISVPVRRDDRRGAERPSLAEVVIREWL